MSFISFDDLDKGVYLVRRKNSVEIKEAKTGSDKRSVKLTDIIPFGQYNIGTLDVDIDRRSVVNHIHILMILIKRNKLNNQSRSIHFQAKICFGRQPFRSLFHR